MVLVKGCMLIRTQIKQVQELGTLFQYTAHKYQLDSILRLAGVPHIMHTRWQWPVPMRQ